MEGQEKLKDWYIRYHLIFGKRYTRKQKDRFLNSLSADMLPFRQDLKLDSFRLTEKDKNEYRNLYVGDPEKADTIICTYYDTPAARFSPYHFFDEEHRMKNTTKFILVTSMIYIVIGLLFTLLVAMPIFQANGIGNILSISFILFYIVFFYFLGIISRGWPKKKNLIQNTSSVLLLLNCIATCKTKHVAFAFVDGGSTNNAGLERLIEQYRSKIWMVDSIGSQKPLYQVNPNNNQSRLIEAVEEVDLLFSQNERLVYLISGNQENDQFVLSRSDLRKNELNDQNMNTAFAFLERVVRRGLK